MVIKSKRTPRYKNRSITLTSEAKRFVESEAERLHTTQTAYFRALLLKYREQFKNEPPRAPVPLSLNLEPGDTVYPPCFMSFSQYVGKLVEFEQKGTFSRISVVKEGISIEEAIIKVSNEFRKQIGAGRVLKGFKLRFEFNHRIYEFRKGKFVCVDKIGEPEAHIIGFELEVEE